VAAAEIPKGLPVDPRLEETVSAILANLAAVIQEENGVVERKAVRALLEVLRWPRTARTPPAWALRLIPEPLLVRLAADLEPTVRIEAMGLLREVRRIHAGRPRIDAAQP
jgi:hypothetical protein